MFFKLILFCLFTNIIKQSSITVIASINHLKPISWSIEFPPSTKINPPSSLSENSQFGDIDQQVPGHSSTIQDNDNNRSSSIIFGNESTKYSPATTFKSHSAHNLQHPVAWSLEQPANGPLASTSLLSSSANGLNVDNNKQQNNGNLSSTPLSYNMKNLLSDINIQQLPIQTKQLIDDYLALSGQNNHITYGTNLLDDKLVSFPQQPIVVGQTRQKQSSFNKKSNSINTNNNNIKSGAWLKPFSSKRRSYDPLIMNDGAQISKVKFDDGNDFEPSLQQKSFNNKDYYTNIPSQIFYDSSPSQTSQSIIERDNINSIVDNLIASSRYSGVTHHNPMPIYYSAGFYPTGHKYSFSSRKGLEKSIGYPVLIGIGAALISFLVLSNLFLTIPLLAMTLMQFLNGNNMIMPYNNNNNNNNPTPNNPNNGNNGQTTVNGRKKRDLRHIELEQKIHSAIEEMATRY